MSICMISLSSKIENVISSGYNSDLTVGRLIHNLFILIQSSLKFSKNIILLSCRQDFANPTLKEWHHQVWGKILCSNFIWPSKFLFHEEL